MTIWTRMIKLSRADPKPVWAMGLKLGEEVGELHEALNHSLGMLPHKTMKEPLLGEVADVIQNALAIAAKAHPNHSASELMMALEHQLKIKTDKWEATVGAFDQVKS